MNAPTKSQAAATEIAALLRARNPLLWVVTREEARAEAYLFEAAASAGYIARTWDCAQGTPGDGNNSPPMIGSDPVDALSAIRQRADLVPARYNTPPAAERGLWIMRDLNRWLDGPIGLNTIRALRNLARELPGAARDRAQAIVVLTPVAEVPTDLAGHATVIDWPLPDREEIAAILDTTCAQNNVDINGRRDAAVDAAIGLTGAEAQACYAKSLVLTREIVPAVIAAEKKRVISRSGSLEWYDPLPGGLDQVGGLDLMKEWLARRALAWSPTARAYGLPAPSGIMLVGPPGTGKTMTAKAVATAWTCPLIKWDFGAAKSKYVGDSERAFRQAVATIEAVGRCVVWVDEIEKALAGATQGAADGGVSADALGTFLTWMQERKGGAFVIATANDVTALPPELMRKGRFDEVWAIDLPTTAERIAVLKSALRAAGRDPGTIDMNAVAAATADFSGAEVAATVPEALFTAFDDGAREITSDDLIAAANSTVPQIKSNAEKIYKLREWAKQNARPASRPESTTTRSGTSPVLDII